MGDKINNNTPVICQIPSRGRRGRDRMVVD